MKIAQFKELFFHSSKIIPLNNAGLSQISKLTLKSLHACNEKSYELGAAFVPELVGGYEQARQDLAQLLGAKPQQTAFFPCTASAISQVALGFPLKPGDEILTWDQEYPSSFYPWKVAAERSGAKLIVAKSGPKLETSTQSFLSHVTNKTKIIAFSWVQYRSGAVTDLQAVTSLAKQKDIFTCADIIQGAGAIPFDFEKSGLDAACGGSHKFLISPLGIGYLLLQEEYFSTLQPSAVGAFSFGTPEDLSNINAQLVPGIQRFEPGAKNLTDIVAFGSSLKLFLAVGMDNIHREIIRLTDLLCDGLEKRGYVLNSSRSQNPRTALVNFGPTEESPLKTLDEIKMRLSENGVLFGVRPPGIRLSPHAFTLDSEIERVLAMLSAP